MPDFTMIHLKIIYHGQPCQLRTGIDGVPIAIVNSENPSAYINEADAWMDVRHGLDPEAVEIQPI